MTTLEKLLNPELRLGRPGFLLGVAALLGIVVASYEVSHFLVLKFLEHDPEHAFLQPLGNFGAIVAAIVCACIGLILMIRRLHDMGKGGILALLMLIPGVNVLFLVYTLVAPGAADET